MFTTGSITATPLMTHVNDGVTQTTYELSEPVPYTRWTGEKRKTSVIVVSHARYDEIDETAVFPGTMDGKIMSYMDLFMTAPACDNVLALTALGLTPTPPTP